MIADLLFLTLQATDDIQTPDRYLRHLLKHCNAHVLPNTTSLHIAVLYNHVNLCFHLLEKYILYIDINAIDQQGCTPLHYNIQNMGIGTCSRNSKLILIALLKAGAELSTQGSATLCKLLEQMSQTQRDHLQQIMHQILTTEQAISSPWTAQLHILMQHVTDVRALKLQHLQTMLKMREADLIPEQCDFPGSTLRSYTPYYFHGKTKRHLYSILERTESEIDTSDSESILPP